MTLVSESLDVDQGFHFQSNLNTPVGHLVTLALAGSALSPDIQVVNPTSGATARVVGVLEGVAWGGGAWDPIQFKACISQANRQLVSGLRQRKMSSISVALDFVTCSFDSTARHYCENFRPSTPPLKGSIERDGATLLMELATVPGPVANPPNWLVSLSVVPPPGQQHLLFAPDCEHKTVRTWGF